jgi:hypothetical protein
MNAEHEEWPLVIGKGQAKVSIYFGRNGKYSKYMVYFRANGRRVRISRSDKAEAIEYGEAMSKFLASGDKPFVLRKAKTSSIEAMLVPESLFPVAADLKVFNLIRVPCVYFLVRDGVVVYVGKSVNLVKRLSKHLESKLFDSVFYLPVTTEDLDAAEKRFITRLNPIYNMTPSPFDWASKCILEVPSQTQATSAAPTAPRT